MKFEDVLREVGDESRFQVYVICLLLLPTSFFNAFHDSIIQMATPDHWCRVPEIAHLSPDLQRQLIRPYDNVSSKTDNCHRYDLDYSTIRNVEDFWTQAAANYSGNLTEIPLVECGADGYLYDQTLYTETAVTWYNFVCDQDFYVNNILSMSLVGLALLTPIISNLSDRIGRRKTIMIILILAEVACINPLLTKSLPTFIFVKILAGGVINVFYQIPFVMTQEVVSQRFRTRSSCISAILYSLGSCSVPIVAKLTRNWVLFAVFQSACTLPFILAFGFLPESPFWLISTKRYEEAYEQMKRIAIVNRKPVPDNLMAMIKSINLESENGAKSDSDSFISLFVVPGLRFKTFALSFAFIACLIGYGGIAINTINLEAHNQLYNFLMLSMVDIPATLLFWWLLTTRFGRRWSNVLGFGLCGVALMIPAIPGIFLDGSVSSATLEILNTACTIVGKFGVAGTYMVTYQHSSELFPTTLRNQGIGLCATVSSLVGICLPQLIYLAKYGTWIPLFIIGVICLAAAIITSFLPETLNEYLPQRAADSAKFGADRPYFCLAKSRLSKDDKTMQNDGEVNATKTEYSEKEKNLQNDSMIKMEPYMTNDDDKHNNKQAINGIM